MSLLIEFLESNKDKLSQCDIEAIHAGIYIQRKMLGMQISELSSIPVCKTTMSDMLRYFDFGILYMNQKGRSSTEKDCGDMLILLWDYLMPKYKLIKRELSLPSKRRVDIMAESNGVGVVIELKHSTSSEENKAPEQVKKYINELKRINGKPYDHLIINKTGSCSDFANVMTWDELGIYGGFAHAPECFDVAELAEICEVINIYPKMINGKLAYRYDVIFDYIHGGM